MTAELQGQRPPFTVGGLGEIAIRCADLDAMEAFYADVLGLTRLAARAGGIVFFDLGPGVAGHTQVLALFGPGAGTRPDLHPEGVPQTGGSSSLHHLALGVTPAEQEKAIAWYAETGQPHRIEEFDWIGWRGVFTQDPEGNTVELVARIKEPAA